MSNAISDAFSLTRLTIDENLPAEVEVGGEKKLPDDFDKARSNVLGIIDTTTKAVAELYNLATQSQSARFYEALNATLKTAVDANRSLLDMHETVRRTSIMKQPPAPQSVTHNNLYITTSELQAMISRAREDNDIRTIEAK